jgi:hypothetical protein
MEKLERLCRKRSIEITFSDLVGLSLIRWRKEDDTALQCVLYKRVRRWKTVEGIY